MARTTAAQRAGTDADIERLRSQVTEIGSELGVLLERAKKDGGALAEAELSQLQSRLQTLTGDLKERGIEAYGKVEETVKEHPGTSLLTAFAAGALLALLLRK